jgi:cytochrome bd-type quinol oxidase subunit 1
MVAARRIVFAIFVPATFLRMVIFIFHLQRYRPGWSTTFLWNIAVGTLADGD